MQPIITELPLDVWRYVLIFTAILGIGLTFIFALIKWQKNKRKTAPHVPSANVSGFGEVFSRLFERFEAGEEPIVMLDNLYHLLRQFYFEQRGSALGEKWEDLLANDEKETVRELQGLYGRVSVPRESGRGLFKAVQKILEGGGRHGNSLGHNR